MSNSDIWNKITHFLNCGLNKEAVELLNKISEKDPDNLNVLFYKGYALEKLDLIESLICYTKAIEINPNFEEALVNKANILIRLQQYKEALNCCEKALELNPKDSIALNNRGEICYNQGLFEEAIKNYNDAIAIKPNYQRAIENKKRAIQKFESKCKELVEFEISNFGKESSIQHLKNMAITLSELGKLREAITCCDEILEIKSDLNDILCLKGFTYLNLYEYEKAYDEFTKVLNVDSKNKWALFGMGKFFQEAIFRVKGGEKNPRINSVEYYDKVLDIDSSIISAKISKATALVSLNLYDQAKKAIK